MTDSAPAGGYLSRYRGPVSLALAGGGLLACEAAIWAGWLPGAEGRVLATAFEGATVGGLADWFAVSALFHRIPLPGLSRHTDLLARKRERRAEGIVEMTETRWLAPDVLRERLAALVAADTDAFGAGSAEAVETDATGTAVVAGASPRTSSRSAGSCTSVTSSPRTTSSSKSSSSSKAVGSVTSTCAVAPSTMPMPVVSVPSVVASTPLSAFSPSFSLRSGATFHTPDHSWTPCAPAPG